MSNDPYRGAPQPADRRVINRSGAASAPSAAYRADEQPASRDDFAPPVSAPRSSGSRRSDRGDTGGKSNKGLLWTIVILLVVVVIAVIGWIVWSNASKGDTGIDSSRYQAVFMEDGRVVFGKLSAFNDESMRLTNVYALGASEEAEGEDASSAEAANKLQLVPTVKNVHGPEDEMIIMKAKILYFQNLRTDSEAAKLIESNSN